NVHILGLFQRGCSACTCADGLDRNLAADCVSDDVYELGDHGYEPVAAMGSQLSHVQPRGMGRDRRPGGSTSDNPVGDYRDGPGLANRTGDRHDRVRDARLRKLSTLEVRPE